MIDEFLQSLMDLSKFILFYMGYVVQLLTSWADSDQTAVKQSDLCLHCLLKMFLTKYLGLICRNISV